MARPLFSQSWSVLAAPVRNVDLFARRITREIGGSWTLGAHGAHTRYWRVQDHVRMELAIDPDNTTGTLRLRLHAEPEYWSLRGCIPGATGSLALPLGVGGMLWSELLLVASLSLVIVAGVLLVAARRPRPAEAAATRAQLDAAAIRVDGVIAA